MHLRRNHVGRLSRISQTSASPSSLVLSRHSSAQTARRQNADRWSETPQPSPSPLGWGSPQSKAPSRWDSAPSQRKTPAFSPPPDSGRSKRSLSFQDLQSIGREASLSTASTSSAPLASQSRISSDRVAIPNHDNRKKHRSKQFAPTLSSPSSQPKRVESGLNLLNPFSGTTRPTFETTLPTSRVWDEDVLNPGLASSKPQSLLPVKSDPTTRQTSPPSTSNRSTKRAWDTDDLEDVAPTLLPKTHKPRTSRWDVSNSYTPHQSTPLVRPLDQPLNRGRNSWSKSQVYTLLDSQKAEVSASNSNIVPEMEAPVIVKEGRTRWQRELQGQGITVSSRHLEAAEIASTELTSPRTDEQYVSAEYPGSDLQSRLHNEKEPRGPIHSGLHRRPYDAKPLPKAPTIVKEAKVVKQLYIPSAVTVERLAKLMGIRLGKLQDHMESAGLGNELAYDYVLSSDYAAVLAEDFGFNAVVDDDAAFDLYPPSPHPHPETLPLRPPVVTIMGHVDHGKTTLLDNLRKTSVAKGEAGGITQHIGAFSVPVKSSNKSSPKTITFLDTPGHAAFTAMRARGAQVTDIIVLVVAADDGVMPQTREVLQLIKNDQARGDKLGVVVAINKTDKPDADIEYVQKELLGEGLELEAFEGNVPSVNVSGLTGAGLPELVETLSALSEMQDLRAERDDSCPVFGYVLESRVQKGLGSVATILVLRGCLKPGMHLISGTVSARTRVMVDSANRPVKAAYPGDAVTVSGWKSVPTAGDNVLSGSESDIKKAISNRDREQSFKDLLDNAETVNEARRQQKEQREKDLEIIAEARDSRISRQRLERQLAVKAKAENSDGPRELPLIIKADVSGSEEAVVEALQSIGNKHAFTKVIHSAVGDVTESDVQLAKTTGGVVVAFSVKAPRQIQAAAEDNAIDIVSSPIIYRLIEDIQGRVVKLLPPIVETTVTAEVVVQQMFDIKQKRQVLKVAGCKVHYGTLNRSDFVWVIRNGETIFDGLLNTLKHLKENVTEVRKGQECGLSIEGFDSLQVDDTLKFYKRIEKPGIL